MNIDNISEEANQAVSAETLNNIGGNIMENVENTLPKARAAIDEMENCNKELGIIKDKLMPTTKDLPFTIHAAPISDRRDYLYPTHTHGLADADMPEFIMDPLAFGPEGNGNMIDKAYRYFKRNKKGLQIVLSGKTVKLPVKRILPKWKNAPNYRICFRTVTDTFEAVKQAYDVNDITEDMRFVQIYIDGDGFALTDEYYRDGVKW
jgi:hypothetical protein